MNILLVDDEIQALSLLKQELNKLVSEKEVIFESTSPLEAIDIAKNNRIDIAFLDIETPEMNGIQLSKKIKETNKFVNIIFSTSHTQYALETYSLYPSGYLLKPILKEDINKALKNLRYPIESYKNGIYAKAFPYFDFYNKEKVVTFPRKKSKELLAYLIALNGAGATKKEICAILFEDESYTIKLQDYFNKIFKDLKLTLKNEGIEYILIKKHDYYAVDIKKINSDYYEYLKGNPEAINSFVGDFMNQYSWSDLFTPNFY